MSSRDDVKAMIDAIEEGYEFFLAYAAQGLTSDQGSKSSGQLRDFLGRAERGLDGLPSALRDLVEAEGLEPAEPWQVALGTLENDAKATLASVRLVAARDSISSQLIDNLNANVHFRALLTDLFLLDDLIGS